ncbi:MAG TPA: PH domain-containing protein [Firmicutes bacterium]|nr:PH domain-containing protein [Bacillota bacterium]
MFRPHPLYCYYDAKKWILLLLLPVLRAVFSPRDIVSILLASLRDVALAALLIGWSAAKWRRARYSLHGGLTLRQGLLYRRTLRISAEDAASVEMERTPLMWLAGGRRVRVNTAGLRRRADATIYLPVSATRKVMLEGTDRRRRRYAARAFPVAVMSASSSNAALGLLTLAPAVRQAGQILGREMTGEVYGLMDRLLSIGLPPLFNTLTNVLVLGWAYAFVRTFIRTAGFYAERDGEQLHVTSGLLTRRDVYIDCSRITALELRQTLFMRLFSLHTVTITAAGYGREKGARPLIIPAARPRELCAALDALLPEYPICAGSLRPVKSALWRYVWPPLLLAAGSLLPLAFGGVWSTLAAVWFLAGSWWLFIRLTGYFRAGFGVGRGAVTMRYPRGLALYEIHVPCEVADCLMITRSPWERRNGTCTAELRCFGEKRRRHRVRALPYEPTAMLARRLMEMDAAVRK